MSAVTVAAWVLTAATPAPVPGSQDVNPTDGGSPGFVGFVITFLLAVLVIGLAFSLVRVMRRMDHNAKAREASEVPDVPADRTPDKAAQRDAGDDDGPTGTAPGPTVGSAPPAAG